MLKEESTSMGVAGTLKELLAWEGISWMGYRWCTLIVYDSGIFVSGSGFVTKRSPDDI